MERHDKTITSWVEYSLIDSGNGRKLEKFGTLVCDRPDPQALWKKSLTVDTWASAQATFSQEGTTPQWVKEPTTLSEWGFGYKDIRLTLSFSEFKHVGVFPEHAWQWDFIQSVGARRPKMKLLNLFGYTGAASIAGAIVGMEVTHVDASKKMIDRTKENAKQSGLRPDALRVVCEDALKYAKRLIERGETFEAIVCDPPSFGRGPKGELWKIEEDLSSLVALFPKLLSGNPAFVLLNGYAAGYSARTFGELLCDTLPPGVIQYGDVGIVQETSLRTLTTGIYGLWQKAE